MISRILLALDDPSNQKTIKSKLGGPDVLVEVPRSRNGIWRRLNRETCDLVVLSSVYVPIPKIEMIRALCELPGSPSLILVTPRNDPEERARMLAAGAEEVMFSGLSTSSFLDVVRTILEKHKERTRHRLDGARPTAQPRLTDFVSNSPVMQDFLDLVGRMVHGSTSLLIQGETGVGKERLAMAIHAEGTRSQGPFIAVNCGAWPESLLESELFGHEEGAFTGATRARRGCFEMAHQGTIFLDEIGEMPHSAQVRLLRVLQDRTVQRVGGERPVSVDVRIMAATNRDLEKDVEAGGFRRDLYYRLSVVNLTVPPLRQRKEDIADLVKSYLDFLRVSVGREVTGITEDTMEALESYAWPGNVRELINVLERGMLLCSDETITLRDLPENIALSRGRAMTVVGNGVQVRQELMGPEEWFDLPLAAGRRLVADRFEEMYLSRQLHQTRGRVGETAAAAGMTPRALHTKMKKYGLHKEDFKSG